MCYLQTTVLNQYIIHLIVCTERSNIEIRLWLDPADILDLDFAFLVVNNTVSRSIYKLKWKEHINKEGGAQHGIQ